MKKLLVMAILGFAFAFVVEVHQAIAQNYDEGPSQSANSQRRNLDNNPKKWGVFYEGSPTWEKDAVLRCSLTGGAPYSTVHCYRNFPGEPTATRFTLSLSFLFTPLTTCNNADAPSIVQSLEFTMNKWHQNTRYEFALQWNNVGGGAPQWRYWDPHQPSPNQWVPISPTITQCMEGGIWHTLVLKGRIINGQIRYDRFTIDNQVHDLAITVDPVSTPGEPDRLAIAVQLDGNFQSAPYDVLLDEVNFSRSPLH